MKSCKDISHLISEGQERQLSLKERINLRLHVWMCSSCRRFEKQIILMRKIMRRKWTQDTAPANKQLSSEAQERIRLALKANNIEQSNK